MTTAVVGPIGLGLFESVPPILTPFPISPSKAQDVVVTSLVDSPENCVQVGKFWPVKTLLVNRFSF